LYDNHHHRTVIDRTRALQIALIGTAVALVTLFASMATNQQAQMQQQQQQSSGLPPIRPQGIVPQKPPPLTVPSPPPSQAELHQIPQSALQQQEARNAYAKNMLDIINAKMNATHDFSQERFFSLLQQLHGQGMINCPHPGQPPFLQCELAPKHR
jgi:hypothetical protein